MNSLLSWLTSLRLGTLLMLLGSFWKFLVLTQAADASVTSEIVSSCCVGIGVVLSTMKRNADGGAATTTVASGKKTNKSGSEPPKAAVDGKQKKVVPRVG